MRPKKIANLKNVFPELNNIYSPRGVIPQMSIYEGRDRLIEIIEDAQRSIFELGFEYAKILKEENHRKIKKGQYLSYQTLTSTSLVSI